LADDDGVPLVKPLRLCPHRRSLLYRSPGGSTWCLCTVVADPADQHLDDRLEAVRKRWDESGRAKEPFRDA
jgi:hypothetical protein